MRAELRYLHSPDTGEDPTDPGRSRSLALYAPWNLSHFGLLVQAFVGPEGQPGEESFDFVVCTRSWLAQNIALPKGFAFLRHHLIVEHWNYALVERAISDLCRRTDGPSWTRVGEQLTRYGRWEFEDSL